MASDNFRENLQPYCISVEGFPSDTDESQVRQLFKTCLKAENIAGAQLNQTKWLMLFHDRAEVDGFLRRGGISQQNYNLQINVCVPCDIPTSWEKVDLQTLGPSVVPGETTQQKDNFGQQPNYGPIPGYGGFPAYPGPPQPGYQNIQYPGYGPYPGQPGQPGQPGNEPQMYHHGYQYPPHYYDGQHQGPNNMGARPGPTGTENLVYPAVSTPGQGPPGGPPPTEQVQGQGQSPGITGEGEGHQHPVQDGSQPLSPGRQPQTSDGTKDSDVKPDEQGRQSEGVSSGPGYYGQPTQQHGPGRQPQPSDGRMGPEGKPNEQGRPGEGLPSGPGYYGQPTQQHGPGTQPHPSNGRMGPEGKLNEQGRPGEDYSSMPVYHQPQYYGQMYGPGGMYTMPQFPGQFAPRFRGPYPQGQPPPYSPYPRMHPGPGGSPRMAHPYQTPNQPSPESPSYVGAGSSENATADEAERDKEEEEDEEEEAEQLGMIKVTDLSPKTTEDTLTYFFENRRKSGGGEIEEIDFQKDTATAIITFKDPAAVDRVLQKLPLLLEKKQIKVERFVPESYDSGAMGKDGSEEENSGEEGSKPASTIEVRCIKDTTSVDTIELYFESKKAAGKSVEIQKIDDSERDEGVIYITYETEEEAKTVAEREHKLEGIKLEVKLYIPPPPPKPRPLYLNKVLIRGKNPDTTKDGLENFLEAKANVTPTHFLPGEEEDTVLVTFEEPPDFEKLELACKKKALDKHFLKVFRVPISNCILVKGAGEKTTESTLEFYFENTRRSGGGDVTEVKDQGDGSYLIYFEDHTVIDSVCGRSHTVDNQTLDVKLYHELIGDSGEDGPKFKVPDAWIITDLDPRKIQFVNHSQPNKDGLEKQLTAQHTKIIWPEKLADPVKLECLLTKDIKDCRTLAKAWKQTARASLDKFLDVLLVFRHQILQDAWDGVLAQLQDMNISHPDGVTVAVEKVSFEIFIMGHKKFATEVSQSVEKIIKKIADELDRKKKQVKETTSPIKHHQVIMLSHNHYTETMEKKYPGMKVTLDFKARTVTYEGLYGEVTSAKLEMYEIINAMVSSDVGDFNKGRYAYLQEREVKQYVAGKMKEEKIMSVWEMQDNRFVVYSMTDDAAVRAAHILKESVLETIVDVKKESSPLLTSDRWASEEKSIKDSCRVMVQMKVKMDKPCIVIYSTDADAGIVRERVTDFLSLNTIYNTKLTISTGMLRYLQSHCTKEINKIAEQHKADQVSIDIDNMGIEIKGTEVGLSKAKMDVGDVIERVEKKAHDLKKPGITKLMTSEDSKPKVSQVEKSHGVVIVPSDESEDDVIGGGAGDKPIPAPRRRDGVQEMARCSQLDYHVMVMMGDITNLKVDVLVNAANKELQHAGGLAKAIVDKGGKSIQRDCDDHIKRRSRLLEGEVYLGKPGNLQCNFIAHAVGPVWQGGRNNEEDMLREAVLKSMEEANNNSQTSIALPALGAGVFGYPAHKSTKTIVEAVDDFYGDNPGCSIRDVYLCDVNQKNVDLFIKAVQKQFGIGNVIVTGQGGGARDKWSAPQAKPRKGWQQATPGAAPTFSPGPIETNISIQLVKGQIAKQKVDIIVNTCSKDLKLSNGAVSSSLLSAAGTQLQAECNQNYQSINFGEIAVTGGYSLKCQNVCHGALPGWDGGASSLAVLQKFMLACLQEATKNNYQSIAFPAMGTGNLSYPRDLVAREMFKIVTNYSIQNPSSSVNKVLFVIYDKDAPTIKAFETAEKSRGMSHAGGQRHSRQFGNTDQQDAGHRHHQGHPPGRHQDPVQPSGHSGGNPTYDEVLVDVGSITLKISQGDITQAEADAIVNGTNKDLDLRRGNVSKVILKRGGKELELQINSLMKEMKRNGIVCTTSDPVKTGMPCTSIIHLNVDCEDTSWKKKFVIAMEMAETRACKSLAFPALGTGIGSKPEEIASAFVEALVDFEHTNPDDLREVSMVVYQQSMFQKILSAMEMTFQTYKKSKGYFRRFTDYVSGAGSDPKKKQPQWNPRFKKIPQNTSSFTIVVYGRDQKIITKAISDLENKLDETFKRKVITDDILKSFTLQQENELKDIEKKFEMEVEFEKRIGRIKLMGLPDSISNAVDMVHEMMLNFQRQKQAAQEAQLISDMVQWYYIEVTSTGEDLQKYVPEVNRILERGYRDNQNEVEFMDNHKNIYVVDLQSCEEYMKSDPDDKVKVIRRCQMTDSTFDSPGTWTDMQPTENMTVVNVPNSGQEFQTVSGNFLKSIGTQRTVHKVERIQNRTLYQQFVAKKKQMDSQNPSGTQNERMLWHGTAPNTVDSINAHGFNRSYCGKNAVAYGNGVYFAVNSQYSAQPQYAVKDASGHQRMYQCRVLTGEFCKGQGGMRVPPQKGGQGHILFDSVADNPNGPSIFVIFHDTQAYPEYLITFS